MQHRVDELVSQLSRQAETENTRVQSSEQAVALLQSALEHKETQILQLHDELRQLGPKDAQLAEVHAAHAAREAELGECRRAKDELCAQVYRHVNRHVYRGVLPCM